MYYQICEFYCTASYYNFVLCSINVLHDALQIEESDLLVFFFTVCDMSGFVSN